MQKTTKALSEAVTNTIKTTVHITTTTPASKDQENLGLIIGLSVGIPCGVALIIALAVAFFYFYKKKLKKTQLQIEARECSCRGSFYETRITMSRAASNIYDDVDIPHRSEAVYDNVLPTNNSVYETTLPKK
ncbi:uncharacterized protein LOC143768465 isoform X3 [Ranitomeya variabilis]|uniref:uncharacterized protein LOC143768465 isoform X3 n=1 Tax=Ranitomeya variabilis TaxID=490064 RepID=UPI0040575B0C